MDNKKKFRIIKNNNIRKFSSCEGECNSKIREDKLNTFRYSFKYCNSIDINKTYRVCDNCLSFLITEEMEELKKELNIKYL